MKFFTLILAVSLLYSCSSGIDPDLLAQIENRTELTDELFDHYEELNEELMEVIIEQDYAYKKLIKARNALRVVNSRIISRKKRLQMSRAPQQPEVPAKKDGEQETQSEQPQPAPNPAAVATHQEKLNEYTEEQAELQAESDDWLAQTRNHTAKALQLRTARNRAYDEYTKSRQALKELNKKAGQTN
jgi:uncharacterized coiled-coil DUF342 family protein